MKIKLQNGDTASEDAILRLEAELGYALPNPFKAFVRTQDGAKPETNIFRISSNNESGVNGFIPVAKIAKQKSGIDGFPERGCPVAWAEGGNYVYLDASGVVFFWDHEIDDDAIRLADDFGLFLEKLEPFDVNTIQLKPGQVKRAWVDPEFLKKLKEKK